MRLSADVPASTDPLHRLALLTADALGFSDTTISTFQDGQLTVLVATVDHAWTSTEVTTLLDAAVRRGGAPLMADDLLAPGALDVLDASQRGGSLEGARSYLGVPLTDPSGVVLGVLSVTDPEPRVVDATLVRLLQDIGEGIREQLGLTGPDPAATTSVDADAADLARAIAAGEIVPWYQPVVDLATERMVGVEALARWIRPSGKAENAAFFIGVAERTDLVLELDLAVIAHALRDLRRWLGIDPTFRLNVNLSGRHLDHPGWADAILRTVEKAGVSSASVSLELTETSRPSESAELRNDIQHARDLGFKVWFDDFGSGWSSLQDLVHLPVDGLKLDRSFAIELGTRVDDVIIEALAGAAGQLGLPITIEGIETRDQATRALQLGCTFAQGYLWAPGLPGAVLEERLVAARAAESAGPDPTGISR